MIKLQNILAENMRRFGTKNLSEQAPGAAPAPAAQSASVPPSLTLNYDNGGFRMSQMFDKSQNMVWDMNATFAGGPNGLTLTQVVFKPGDAENSATLKPVAIPLAKPFTVATPLDFKLANKNLAAFKGIQLNLKAPGIATVTAANPKLNETMWMSLNMQIGQAIYDSLVAYAGAKGWYTGPKQLVAKQYALFTNHDGRSAMPL